jgi:hypothetical protein
MLTGAQAEQNDEQRQLDERHASEGKDGEEQRRLSTTVRHQQPESVAIIRPAAAAESPLSKVSE